MLKQLCPHIALGFNTDMIMKRPKEAVGIDLQYMMIKPKLKIKRPCNFPYLLKLR